MFYGTLSGQYIVRAYKVHAKVEPDKAALEQEGLEGVGGDTVTT